ncbi:uncharacterized protein LOC141650968 [Silene latifolia]|uniref:uncharacterized protein LOC141650968 n=1 Tax=Silene latifolia TaxID=37657 RepID=UPI003D787158
METMVSARELEKIRNSCGFSSGICVSSRGRAGGLGLWWRDINVQLISYNNNHILVEILDAHNAPVWRAGGIYGWPETSNKFRTWDLMRSLCGGSRVPIVLFGDFNEILSGNEKEGGAVRRESQMDAFRGAIDDCALHDLGYRGNVFTWQRGLTFETMIRERLDRAIATTEWSYLFPRAFVQHFPIYSSDHSAIIIKEEEGQFRGGGRRGFKFEPFWAADEQCRGVVKEAWEGEIGEDVPGKVKACSVKLAEWARQRFGDVKRKLREREADLTFWQRQPPSADMLSKCREIVNELDVLRRQVETYWYTRARKCELRDGDKNTSYFHHKAKQRKRRNAIKGIEDNGGQWRTDEGEITNVIEEYFNQLFCSSNPSGLEDVLRCIPEVISPEMNAVLDRPLCDDEVKSALFSMHPNKAPGPDGMHALFYQRYWEIIGPDLCTFTRQWWEGRGDIDRVNMTNVVLIPKCDSPKKITEYRPISLCNVNYKVISKTLANRLKGFLNDFITENQSAFTPGRRIKRGGEGRHGTVALKLDMSKAYDRVEWVFLDEVMKRMGFSSMWRNRVMNCITTVAHSFLINGKASGLVRPSRGLRQGDPISPYLFLLCADAFSHMLNEAVRRGSLHGARVCRGAPRVSHLFFADDSILFARANLRECSKIAEIISKYERASGQKINYSKSEVVFSKKVLPAMRTSLCEALGVREVDRHEKYLGLPTIIGRSKKSIFACLKERVWKKMQGWKEKMLSKPGKEILIKAVAQAIPTYMMSMFAIPEGLIEELHMTMARFWWGSTESQRKIHWWRWEKLCKPKAMGGMGFRDLRVFNQALLAKQIWRLLTNPGSLVGRVLKARYFKNDSVIDARRGHDPSFAWRSLWGAKSLLMEGLMWRIGDGKSVRVWEDPWLPGERGERVPLPNIEADPSLCVAAFIDRDTGSWREDALHALLSEAEVRRVQTIPLSRDMPADSAYWWPSRSGDYTVKTGYWLGMEPMRASYQAVEEGGGLWKVLWGLQVPPKLIHFLWRGCVGMLAVKANLFRRHCCPSELCALCEEGVETDIHAVFLCSWTRVFWAASGFDEIMSEAPQSSFREWLIWALQHINGDARGRFLALVWAMWTIRNSRTFEEEPCKPEVVIMGFERMVADYQGLASMTKEHMGTVEGVGRDRWEPPSEGALKINTDAAIMEDSTVGLGVVGRDCAGTVKVVTCRRVRARWTAEMAEAKALLFGIEVVQRMGLGNVSLETDALNVVRAVRKEVVLRSPFGLCVREVGNLAKSIGCRSFSHVKRGGNTVAHWCARLCSSAGEEQILVNDFPLSVIRLADLDLIE